MRRLTLFLVVSLMFVAVPSHAAPRCTVRGTSGTDFLSGTAHGDVICARGSRDFVSGQDGNDVLRGGPGDDTVVGGNGADRLVGRGGADKLFAVDGHGNDVLRGGPGKDMCYGEKGDRFRSCAKRFTNHSPTYPLRVAAALSRALDRVIAQAMRVLCRRDVTVCIGV